MSLDCNVTVLEDRRVVVQKQMSNVEWVILRCGRKREDWHSIGPNVRWEQNNRCSIGKMAPKRGNCWLFKSRSVSSPRPSPSLALLEHKHPNTISPLHTFLWNPTRSGSSWRQGRWSSRAKINLMIEETCVVVSVRSTWVVASEMECSVDHSGATNSSSFLRPRQLFPLVFHSFHKPPPSKSR